jgi:hypothetical protein
LGQGNAVVHRVAHQRNALNAISVGALTDPAISADVENNVPKGGVVWVFAVKK